MKWIKVLFFVYLACVAYLCFGYSPEGVELPMFIFGIPFDKIVHFSMFLPFPILGPMAFAKKDRYWRALVFFFILAMILAFALEIMQTPLTDGRRTTDMWDYVANIAGVTSGVLIMAIAGYIKRLR